MKQILVEYKCGVPVPEQMSEAIREIQTNKYRNVLIHIFSGVPDEDMLVHLCQELRDCCNTDLIVGTMSAGVSVSSRLPFTGLPVVQRCACRMKIRSS